MKRLTASDYYKSVFGSKVYKICVDGGCTCPNRDGTKGKGGCTFCSASGSGDFASDKSLSITEQIKQAKLLVENKIKNSPDKKYIVYFQNFTNTYGDPSRLRQMWDEALAQPGICGLAIGTRPDCISQEILLHLKELSEKTFIQLELGLQTSNELVAKKINRCYDNNEYQFTLSLLYENCPRLHVVTHIIFGLPGETYNDMMASVDFAVKCGTHGIKLTVLYVTKGTELFNQYKNGEFKVLEMEEYLSLLKSALGRIPENVVIHRVTGDPPKKLIEAPLWTCNKKLMLNETKKILGID